MGTQQGTMGHTHLPQSYDCSLYHTEYNLFDL